MAESYLYVSFLMDFFYQSDEEDLTRDDPDKQKAEQVSDSKKKEKSQKLPAGEERLENEVNHEVRAARCLRHCTLKIKSHAT